MTQTYPVENHQDVGLQCDQMARLIFQYLAVYDKENVPNRFKICQSRLKIFAKFEINNPKFARRFFKFCQKVAKF